ncbi:hypothetical protein AOQ84DRAFT_348486 [Glonium stellatum]|uniref:Uncharacterized protein n=1 Tax=Glonium stellatum TaxID=574774 RepID=A0A8E2EQF7_9PEZI|nr:hypothetical protein AOQ84DRAFT_348486 [Glonium stellatum]
MLWARLHKDWHSLVSGLVSGSHSDQYPPARASGDTNRDFGVAETAAVASPNYPNRARLASKLASRLSTRFEKTGIVEDLKHAVKLTGMAVEATPYDHPDRAFRLRSLAMRLSRQFELQYLSKHTDNVSSCTPSYSPSIPLEDPLAPSGRQFVQRQSKGESTPLSSTMRCVIRKIKRWARPPVKEGYRRIEWKCTCGQEMYRDFSNSDPKAIDTFLVGFFPQSLPDLTLASSTKDSGALKAKFFEPELGSKKGLHGLVPPDINPGIQGPTGAAAISGLNLNIRPVPELSPTVRDIDDSQSTSSEIRTSSGLSNHPQVSQRVCNRSSHPNQKFLEVCINTGQYTVSLGEINVSDIKSDGQLFEKINQRYHEMRGSHIRRILRKPVDIHFVRFSLQRTYRVGILGKPMEMPPEEEVRKKHYEFSCPFPPPMDSREFLHHFYIHGDVHPQSIYLERLPKKLEPSLSQLQSQGLTFGWGIHIIEGPNKSALSWACFVILLLSFVVSVVYAVTMKTQEQGFGIGQWMVAVLSVALIALYHQWEEA